MTLYTLIVNRLKGSNLTKVLDAKRDTRITKKADAKRSSDNRYK